MKPFVRDTLMRQRARLHELDALLSAPDVVDNMDRFRALSREHADASTVIEVFNRYLQREDDLAAANEMLNDADMAEMAQEEIDQAQDRPGDSWTPSCSNCCCPRTPTTSATPSWRSAPAPAATSRRCSPATWRA